MATQIERFKAGKPLFDTEYVNTSLVSKAITSDLTNFENINKKALTNFENSNKSDFIKQAEKKYQDWLKILRIALAAFIAAALIAIALFAFPQILKELGPIVKRAFEIFGPILLVSLGFGIIYANQEMKKNQKALKARDNLGDASIKTIENLAESTGRSSENLSSAIRESMQTNSSIFRDHLLEMQSNQEKKQKSSNIISQTALERLPQFTLDSITEKKIQQS